MFQHKALLCGCPDGNYNFQRIITELSDWQHRPGPVFCLLLGVSSDYAQPITGQVTEVTCQVIGWAQHELTLTKTQKTGPAGPWFNIKMLFYLYRKSLCEDKTILRPSDLHNGISYIGKMTSLYWIRVLVAPVLAERHQSHSTAMSHANLYPDTSGSLRYQRSSEWK